MSAGAGLGAGRPGSAGQAAAAPHPAHKYAGIKRIGKGSYGVVDLVQNIASRKLYVMKLVNYTSGNVKESLKEVSVLKMLKHPNIVEFVEAFVSEDGGKLCIVMGFCECGDLIDKIRDARERRMHFSENQIMEWFVQMCMALAYLHDRNILHRDMKPHNVFLTSGGRVVKVGDFGVTRILEHTSSMAQTTIGTPYYVSPEICNNQPYNNKSDVWALGVVLYELCALRVPFDAKDFTALRVEILRSQPKPLNSKYSAHLRQLVSDMLIKNPTSRPDIRAILKRPYCQHHLKILMQRHSQSPEAVPATPAAPVAEEMKSAVELQSELDAKRQALEAAERQAANQQVMQLNLDNVSIKGSRGQDILAGLVAGSQTDASKKSEEEIQRLQADVARIEDKLVATCMRVHKVAIAEEQHVEQEEVANLASTVVRETKLDDADEDDEGKHPVIDVPGGAEDAPRHEDAVDEVEAQIARKVRAAQRSDSDAGAVPRRPAPPSARPSVRAPDSVASHSGQSSSRESDLSDVGKQLVLSLSLGNAVVETPQSSAETPVARKDQLGHLGHALLTSPRAAGNTPREPVRVMPGADATGMDGTTPRPPSQRPSSGRLRPTSARYSDETLSARDAPLDESRSTAGSRRASSRDLLETRPTSAGRPLTSGSDFNEGLDNHLRSVVLEADKMASRAVAPSAVVVAAAARSRPVSARRRPSTNVLLDPIAMQ